MVSFPFPFWLLITLALFLAAVLVPVVNGLSGALLSRSAKLFALVGLGGAWGSAFLVVADDWMMPSLLLAWALMVLTCVDLMVWRLPDAVTLPLAAGGVAIGGLATDPVSHLVGAVVGYGAFWSLARGYRLLRKREGLGLGDAKLLLASGAWLGWQGLPSIVLIASMLALIFVGIYRALRVSSSNDAIFSTSVPFGPALCASTWIVWLCGSVFI